MSRVDLLSVPVSIPVSMPDKVAWWSDMETDTGSL